MKRPRKFQRPLGVKSRAAADARGTVRIVITLSDKGRDQAHVKGNITRTISVASAKVSEVAAAIDRALF